MPIFGLPVQKKPKNVQENLGLDNTGGVVNPPSRMADMAQGGAMGSLTEQTLSKREEINNPDLFKRKKRNINGFNEGSGFGQFQERQ